MSIGIDASRLLAQMQMMAAKAQNANVFENGIAGPGSIGKNGPQDLAGLNQVSPSGSSQFENIFKASLDKVNSLQTAADQKTASYLKGESTDLPDVMISIQSASMGLKAATEVRNKVVDAYNNIMNMSM